MLKRGLRKECCLLLCTVINQPEFGHEVVSYVVGNGTDGRQAPEDPIIVVKDNYLSSQGGPCTIIMSAITRHENSS